MNWLQQTWKIIVGSFGPLNPGGYQIRAKCNRCGELLQARINLNNDLSAEDYDDYGRAISYACRKILQGSGRCFQMIEVALRFDHRKMLIEKNITGGTFVDE